MRFVIILIISALMIVFGEGAMCGENEVIVGAEDGKLNVSGAEVVKQPEGLRFVDAGLGDGVQALSMDKDGGKLEVRLERPLGTRGTVSFLVRPRVWYRGGPDVEKFRCDVVKINRVGKFWFQNQSSDTLLAWDWDWDLIDGADWIGTYVPELPGPEWYHLVYTWDSEKGLFDAYFNGYPQRLSASPKPWVMTSGDELVISADVFDVADVNIKYEYMKPERVAGIVPEECGKRRGDLLGFRDDVKPMVVDGRLGKLLYESSMINPESIKGWVMEGPGVLEYKDGWLEMSSALVDGVQKGHIVHWCPKDFPESFVAEWEIEQMKDNGFCIVFFAAKGENGEDIFDPGLPKRDGTFKQYTSEAIVSYHISYYATSPASQGRTTSNLRKNNHFYLIANGPPGIEPGDMEPRKVRLIRDGGHVQLLVDGKVIIDHVDDGKHYGPVLGGGKIGLRHMEWTKARYRNFRVWELNGAEVK